MLKKIRGFCVLVVAVGAAWIWVVGVMVGGDCILGLIGK